MSQPDIEIYLKGPSAEQINNWLSQQFDELEVRSDSPKRQVYQATWGDESFEVMVLIKVQSGYTSIWFDNAKLPWQDDKECAQQALQDLPQEGLSIRCVASGWQEGDAPDQWLQLTPDNEEVINWPG